jgi:hypothetical protein
MELVGIGAALAMKAALSGAVGVRGQNAPDLVS